MASSTASANPGIYVPGSAGSASHGGSSSLEVPAFLEKAMESMEDYARNEPWAFAAWAFGIGFVLGWKLKPW
jgi:hypothetical protein